jgi:hypothetical protein
LATTRQRRISSAPPALCRWAERSVICDLRPSNHPLHRRGVGGGGNRCALSW